MNPSDWSREEIKQFQRDNFNHLGLPLSVDGIAGPETQWALSLYTIHRLRREIILCACSFVDRVEESPKGSNRNPWIDSALRRCGAAPGSKWCAAGLSLWISQPGLTEVREASVDGIARVLPRVTEMQAADAWVIKRNGISHCGLAIGFSPDEVMSVEGNQNDGVHVTVRPQSDITSFHRTVPAPSIPGVLTSGIVRHIVSVV
jgi:hypothetical protein